MACDFCSINDETRSVVRLQNKALRTTNRVLRRKVERIIQETDIKIAALFDTPSGAENALRTIWEGANLSCDPDDYETIADLAAQALTIVKSKLTSVVSTLPNE